MLDNIYLLTITLRCVASVCVASVCVASVCVASVYVASVCVASFTVYWCVKLHPSCYVCKWPVQDIGHMDAVTCTINYL